MQGLTLLIAVVASIFVLVLPPAVALATYVAALVWYPDFLRIPIGTIDISVGRIVVAVLVLRCLCDSRLMNLFRWSRFDTWVTISAIVYTVMYCQSRPLGPALENRSGFLMDTWLAYVAARLVITDRQALVAFIKSSAVILVPLAVLGMVESVSHWNPYRPLVAFRTWNVATELELTRVLVRWGLARASGPFSHAIMFGCALAMFIPMVWVLRYQRDSWRWLAYIVCGVLILGAFSSMSSCSWVMLMVVLGCLAMERYSQWVKPLLAVLAVGSVFGEIASRRPFYRVVASYVNLAGGQWWQRADLIDAAIEDLGQWFWLGYGDRDPGWGARTGARVTDLNNQFILAGVECGFLGIVAVCVILVASFRGLVRSYRATADKELRSIYWALGSILTAVIVTWWGVSFFGQLPSLLYSVLGIMGSSFAFVRTAPARGVRAQSRARAGQEQQVLYG